MSSVHSSMSRRRRTVTNRMSADDVTAALDAHNEFRRQRNAANMQYMVCNYILDNVITHKRIRALISCAINAQFSKCCFSSAELSQIDHIGETFIVAITIITVNTIIIILVILLSLFFILLLSQLWYRHFCTIHGICLIS